MLRLVALTDNGELRLAGLAPDDLRPCEARKLPDAERAEVTQAIPRAAAFVALALVYGEC